MQDLFAIDLKKLPMTLRTFRDLAMKRGWKKASVIRGKESFIFAVRPDGKEINFCSCSTMDMSYFSGVLADDKYSTYHLLKDLGVNQPETVLLSRNDYHRQLAELLSRHSRVVIKPSDDAHGNDVFVGISDVDEASKIASKVFSRHSGQVLAQEQVSADGPETRAICIGYRFVSAFARIPAMVTGDGIHTVSELIKIENDTIRTAPYQSNLAFIDIDSSTKYLADHDGLADNVPSSGEKIQVVGACNTGKGGTMVDVTASFPVELREEAEKIAKGFGLPVIGVDYFGTYCLEVNSTPALYHPVEGRASITCVEKWLDYLENLPLPS